MAASSPAKGRTSSMAMTAAEEFNAHFEGEKSFPTKAKTRAINGGLRQSHFRSLYWKLFLEIVSGNSIAAWTADIKKARDEYADLRKKHTSNPAAVEGDLKVNNPLSTAKDNTWKAYYADNDLMEVIKLDIKRTHQENDFFVNADTQAVMLNILFTWAKQNPSYGYRQGMNELLAPLILAVSRDAKPITAADTSTVSAMVDKQFVEHDTFALFDRVMGIMAKYFVKVEVKRMDQKERDAAKAKKEKDKILGITPGPGDAGAAPPPPVTVETPIVKKCAYIHNTLLAFYDQVLHRHLDELDVQPTVYSLRWSRLLFAQEFHIEDVMTLWDVLFAYTQSPIVETGLVLADYMCVSMLLYVRKHLMQPDVNFVLKRLMKYPPVEDIRILVERAVELSKIPVTSTPLPPYIEPVVTPPPQPVSPTGASTGSTGGGGMPHPLQQPRPSAGKKDFLSSILDPLTDLTKKIGDTLVGTTSSAPNRGSGFSAGSGSSNGNQPRPGGGGAAGVRPQQPQQPHISQVSHQPQQQPRMSSPPLQAPQPQPQQPQLHQHRGSTPTAGPRPHSNGPYQPPQSSHPQQATAQALTKEIVDLRTIMNEMGNGLTAVVDRLQLELVAPPGDAASAPAAAAASATDEKSADGSVVPKKRMVTVSEDMLFTCVAELKHIKDVLMGRLSTEEIISHLHASRRSGAMPTRVIAPPGTGSNVAPLPVPAAAATAPAPAVVSSVSPVGVTVHKPLPVSALIDTPAAAAAAKPKSGAAAAPFTDPFSTLFGAGSPQAQSITATAATASSGTPRAAAAASAAPTSKPASGGGAGNKSNTLNLLFDDPFQNPLKAGGGGGGGGAARPQGDSLFPTDSDPLR